MPPDYTGIENASSVLKEESFEPSTLETIDMAMHDYLNDNLNLHTTTNKGWTKVPVIWVSAERAYQIKRNRGLRDDEGTLILPVIVLERTSLVKDLSTKGGMWSAMPGDTFVISRKINQERTSKFENVTRTRGSVAGSPKFLRTAKPAKTVYQTISSPMPTWVSVTYSIAIRTEYQEQINELIQPFFTKYGNINRFSITKENHRFEAFVQGDFSFANNTSSIGEEERKYETKIVIKVLGYLVGDGSNSDKPKTTISENFVEIAFPRERAMLGDSPEHIDSEDKRLAVEGEYRE